MRNDDHTTFVHVASPVGSLMAKVAQRMRATQALDAADKAIEARRETGDLKYSERTVHHLRTYEQIAELRQLWE